MIKRIKALFSGKKKKRKKPKNRIDKVKRWLSVRVRKLIFPVIFLTVVFFGWIFLTQPSVEDLHKVNTPGVIIKSEDGRVLATYGDAHETYIPYDELPKALINAVLATEDRDFFDHFGVDVFGILRAMVANVRAGGVVQGGSTVTQQLAKNVFLTPERSLIRKFREVLLALSLERRYSKKEIMAIYLNRVYLGAGNYGMEVASQHYFGKSVRDIGLSEAAILTGLLKAPSRYAPTNNPEASRKRAEQVLVNMVDAELLKPAAAEKAKKELAWVVNKSVKNSAESSRYFTDWVVDQLPEYIGAVSGNVVVTVTLKPDMQRMGEQAIAAIMDKSGEKMKASQASLLSMSPDGAIRAMIGGRDYGESQFNRVVQSKRQPGSAFKMFVYLTALEGGMSPSSTVVDQPITIGKWQPKNYDGEYHGELSLRSALAQSINTISVQLVQHFGAENVIRTARRLGVTSELEPLPSLALGSNELTLLELTNAYAHLASGGLMVEPYGIVSIDTVSGKPLYRRDPSSDAQVINSSVVGMMNVMLQAVMSEGTGRGAAIGRSAAGKTGTTSDYRDAWFIGYTPDLVTGVWVGNDDNSTMKKVTGGTLPAPIWREYMKQALANVPARDLPTSSGFWGSILPWQTDAAPVQERPAGQERPPAPVDYMDEDVPGPETYSDPVDPEPKPEPKRDIHLGEDFWNKLDGVVSNGKVERTYPRQRDIRNHP